MTVVPSEAMAFHLGIVVHDLDASARRYEDIYGAMQWNRFELPLAALPTNPETRDAQVLAAYGRAAGMTFELIQVLSGETVHSLFLKRRGEGIQHIGIWVPDVQAAAVRAVEAGARITAAILARAGEASVQLSASCA